MAKNNKKTNNIERSSRRFDLIRRWVLILLIVAVGWTYLFVPNYNKYIRMKAMVSALEKEIAELEAKKAYNQERIYGLKYDPMVIEHEIRQNLRWVAPGEIPMAAQ